jgi:WD40 repeat protein
VAAPDGAEPLSAVDPGREAAARELGRLVEEEVARLPEKYRLAILLCYWQEFSTEEAARQLGWPKGTVKTRLGKAREVLRERLARRGITLPVGLIATLVAPAGDEAVSATLVAVAVRAPDAASRLGALAYGRLGGLGLSKAKGGLALLMACVLAIGVGAMPRQTPDVRAAKAEAEPRAAARIDRDEALLPDGALARLGSARLRSSASAVAFAPDGTLITASFGRAIARWDLDTCRPRSAIHLPGAPADRSWLSPDGRTLAVFEAEGLRLWNTETGKRQSLLAVDDRSLMTLVVFSPDNRELATAEFISKDGTGEGRVRLWPVADGNARPIADLPSYANKLVFGAGGKRLFAAVDNHSLRCWDTVSGRQLWQNDHWASNLVVAPDGRTLCADTYQQGPLNLFDAENGRHLGALSVPCPNGQPLAFAPDSRTLAQQEAREVVLWDVASRRELRRLPAQGSQVVFSPDGRSLVTLGPLQRWDVATGKALCAADIVQGHRGDVRALAFAPDGRTLATTGHDGAVLLWDVASTRHRAILADSAGLMAPALAFTPDGRHVLTQPAFDTLRLNDAATGKEVRRFRLPATTPGSPTATVARLTADGRTLLVLGNPPLPKRPGSYMISSAQGTLTGWDVETGRQVLSRPTGTWLTLRSAIESEGRLWVLADDGSVHDIRTGEVTLRPDREDSVGGSCAISDDGRLLALTEPARRSVRVYELLTGRLVMQATADLDGRGALAFTPDGRLLVAAGVDALLAWETTSGRPLLCLRGGGRLPAWGSSGRAQCLAVAPDGQIAATGHVDGTALLWDLSSVWKAVPAPRPARTEDCWTALAGGDAHAAYEAIDALAVTPGPALALLRPRLQPVPVSSAWLRQRIADLDSDEFATREAASRALEKVGEVAETELRRALAREPGLEHRTRLERLLAAPWPAPTSEEVRHLRALIVLERIGTAEARAVLRSLAEGAEGARLVRDAKAALTRLDQAARRP